VAKERLCLQGSPNEVSGYRGLLNPLTSGRRLVVQKPMDPSDSGLAQQLLEHQAFLQRLARALVGGDADDLVQDVWQQALERPPRHGLHLRGWLGRVARSLARDRRRGELRRHERETGAARSQSIDQDPGSFEERFELQREVVTLLDALEEPYRSTLLMRYFEGLSPEEIGKRTGSPTPTVKTHLRRGLEQLRAALDRKHPGGREKWLPALVVLAGRPKVGATLTSTGALAVGGIAMTKTWIGAVTALVAIIGAILVARNVEEIRPESAVVESSRLAGADHEPQSETETAARELVSTVPAPGAFKEADESAFLIVGRTVDPRLDPIPFVPFVVACNDREEKGQSDGSGTFSVRLGGMAHGRPR
jgi:RNA polymerase sigma factor (sigma-70 family)